MIIVKYWRSILILTLVGFGPFKATAAPIDLNAFFADPEVTIAADGSSADFSESEFSVFVRLTNDPFLGDPDVIVPGASTLLVFDFIFNEAPGDDDVFSATLFDADSGSVSGVLDTFSVDSTRAGMARIDLAPYVGLRLGMQFELVDLGMFGGSVDSNATVSNLALVSAVPVPAAVWLFGSGFLGLIGVVSRIQWPGSATRRKPTTE